MCGGRGDGCEEAVGGAGWCLQGRWGLDGEGARGVSCVRACGRGKVLNILELEILLVFHKSLAWDTKRRVRGGIRSEKNHG